MTQRTRMRLAVGGCSALGVLAATVVIGAALDRPDPPSDDVVAIWVLAELGAATLAVPLLWWVIGRRSVPAGLLLAALAPLNAATPAAVVAVVLLVSQRSWRVTCAAGAAFVLPLATAALVLGRDDAPALLGVLAGAVAVLVLAGMVLGARRALAEQADRERALVLERARTDERARIAQEMHDSLGHHLSLIALHAGALGRRDDLPPETVRSSSQLVAELSRTAHAELREVLGVLHQGPQPTSPPPGAADLTDVVAQHRAAGAVIDADLAPEVVGASSPGRLSETTSRLLHRVVRELLANAAVHAPGAPVHVVLDAGPDRIELRCRNRVSRTGDHAGHAGHAGLAGRPGGMGLAGIAERVRLAGGEHRAGVVDDHFDVWVSVPW